MNSGRLLLHLFIPFISMVLIAAYCYQSYSGPMVQGISIASAYVSLLLLVITLSIGPLKLLCSGRIPLSTCLRRDLGIWAAVMGIVHTIAGLQVHLEGQFLYYFIFPEGKGGGLPFRYDAFGLTNHLGLLCTIIFVLLLFLSNDFSLKKLGPLKWKRLQRSAYLLLVLVPLHGLIYQLLEKRTDYYAPFLLFSILLVLGLQVAGMRRYRHRTNG